MKTLEDCTVQVLAREWFDRKNGNSYFSARVYVDNNLTAVIPMQYGYGGQYQYEALNALQEQKLVSEDVGALWRLRDSGVQVLTNLDTRCSYREVYNYGKE